MNQRAKSPRGDLVRDTRGGIFNEYIIVVGVVALGLSVAVVALGPKLVKDFRTTRAVISAPIP